MRIDFINLGSGSKGNCTVVRAGDDLLLVDVGFSCREIRARLDEVGIAPERVRGVMVTHGHSDHFKGIPLFCSKFSIPVYCNELTRREIVRHDSYRKYLEKHNDDIMFRLFETGVPFQFGCIKVHPFQTSHDTADSVGYRFEIGDVALAVATDLGRCTQLLLDKLKGAYGLILESNHDVGMLMHSDRTYDLKQRIRGPGGHLSNEQTAEIVSQIVDTGIHELCLGHLSEECNLEQLAWTTTERVIRGKDVHLQIAKQNAITRVLPEGFSA